MTRALRCLPLLALLLLGACQSLPWSEDARAQARERQQFERLLADAWLQRSQQALERGDLNAATTALARARALMPKAPALTNGLGGALQPTPPADVGGEIAE